MIELECSAAELAQQERAKVRMSVDGLLLLSGRRTRGKLGKGDVAGQKFRRRERLRLQKEAELPSPYSTICKVSQHPLDDQGFAEFAGACKAKHLFLT